MAVKGELASQINALIEALPDTEKNVAVAAGFGEALAAVVTSRPALNHLRDNFSAQAKDGWLRFVETIDKRAWLSISLSEKNPEVVKLEQIAGTELTKVELFKLKSLGQLGVVTGSRVEKLGKLANGDSATDNNPRVFANVATRDADTVQIVQGTNEPRMTLEETICVDPVLKGQFTGEAVVNGFRALLQSMNETRVV